MSKRPSRLAKAHFKRLEPEMLDKGKEVLEEKIATYQRSEKSAKTTAQSVGI